MHCPGGCKHVLRNKKLTAAAKIEDSCTFLNSKLPLDVHKTKSSPWLQLNEESLVYF